MKKSYAVILSTVLIVNALLFLSRRRADVDVIDNKLETFPLRVGEWTGEDEKFDAGVIEALNADAIVNRIYQNKSGDVIYLYIGYYGTKKGGRAAHQPRYCYPGSGWSVDILETTELNAGDRRVTVNKITADKDRVWNLAYYWTQAPGGRILTSGWGMNINRFIRRLTTNRDDGAFVQVTAAGHPDRAGEIEKYVRKFSARITETLPNYWPIEG